MSSETVHKENLLVRTIVILAIIAFAAIVRIVPHPWNFTPVGAMALFSGAVVKDRRLAFLFPLLALFAGDIIVGFHKLMPIVYASFLVDVALGYWIRKRRDLWCISGITLLGAIQFFLVTNFAMWAFWDSYPRTVAGLVACYLSGLPLFWNTLAGDAFYAAVLFGRLAIAEHFFPVLRDRSAHLALTAQATD
jgi:hypothetical protein